ncbi:hypothetical protein NE237_025386 [Protea cynaroides]|uniref:Uncharacterized protein n=1 Tax=Protea cynaroides TaxID=273540 RepID=A0A9Q0H2Z2_9MAGN|nr:hypothetical protein NE237_025386 [Protea cynaroides]
MRTLLVICSLGATSKDQFRISNYCGNTCFNYNYMNSKTSISNVPSCPSLSTATFITSTSSRDGSIIENFESLLELQRLVIFWFELLFSSGVIRLISFNNLVG